MSRSSGRRRRRRQQQILRYAVAISALFSAVVLISLAMSQSGRKLPPLERSETGSPTASPVGILSLVVMPTDLPSGFGIYEVEPQSLGDVARNATDPLAEENRLVRLGFVEAAIASSAKPEIAPGELTGTAVTSQVVRFSSDAGASEQVAHDAGGALGSDFRFSVTQAHRVPLGDEAWLIKGMSESGAYVSGLVMRYGPYQTATVYSGRTPVPDETILGVGRKQLSRLKEHR